MKGRVLMCVRARFQGCCLGGRGGGYLTRLHTDFSFRMHRCFSPLQMTCGLLIYVDLFAICVSSGPWLLFTSLHPPVRCGSASSLSLSRLGLDSADGSLCSTVAVASLGKTKILSHSLWTRSFSVSCAELLSNVLTGKQKVSEENNRDT